MKTDRYLILAISLLILLGMLAVAQSQQVEKPSDKPNGDAATGSDAGQPDQPAANGEPAKDKEEEEDKRVRLENADSLYRDKAAHTYFLAGNVVFKHKDITLYCDEAEYFDEDHPERPDTAKAVGNLKCVDPEATITGDLIEADFDKKIVVVTGNVRVVAKKKPDKDEDKAEGKKKDEWDEYAEKLTTMTCDRIEYYYDDDVKKGIATGHIKVVQEDKTGWCDKAVYERIPDIVTLTGNVRILTEDGDELRTPEATISIDAEWIRTGKVSGITFHRDDEEEEKKEEPAGGGEAGGGGGGQ